MSTPDPFEFIRKNPGKRPPSKLRKALAETFAHNAAQAWSTYSGTSVWFDPATSNTPWSEPDIDTIWAPLHTKLKGLISELRKRCLGFVVRQHKTAWQLGYILETGTKTGQHYALRIWVGGSPTTHPHLSSKANKATWILPDDLAAFYAIHNGFGQHGDDGFGVEAVLPSHALEVHPAVIGTNTAGRPILFETGFLAFWIDSVGHRRGYYRQHASRTYTKAFDWDRHTRSVGQLKPALAVINTECVKLLRAG